MPSRLLLVSCVAWWLAARTPPAADLPKVGDLAPEFTLADQDGKPVALAAWRAQGSVLLAFYGRDAEPETASELGMLRAEARRCKVASTTVLAIGCDAQASHAQLARDLGLPFQLLVDGAGEVAARYGLLDRSAAPPRAKRALLLIDADGRVACIDAARPAGAALAGSALARELEQRAQRARRVSFRSRGDVEIAAMYYPVPDASKPAIVFFPGMRFDRRVWDGFARQVQASGFPALAVDLRGQGESIRVGGAEVHVSDALARDRGFAQDMVADAEQAAHWLAENGSAGHGMIYAGSSLGSSVALIAAAGDPGVRAVLLMSPGLDYAGLQTLPAIKKLGQHPVLITCAQEPARADAKELAANAQAAELCLRDQPGHGTSLLETDGAIAGLMLAWLEKIARN
ncbi:MAG: redoxin domain-containing protein [Planctomycetota bacterium]